MIEIIKHAFGFCGDGHTNLLYFFGSIPFLAIIRYKIVAVYKLITLNLSNSLKQLNRTHRHLN